MQKITIIATRHQSLGMCNSETLHQILEILNPQVIFVEIPPTSYKDTYEAQLRKTLESEAIILYADQKEIDIVPVDSDDLPPKEFFRSHESLLKRVEAQTNRNGFDYRNLVDNHRSFIHSHGFSYLNSEPCDKNLNTISNLIQEGLNIINDKQLIDVRKEWFEIHRRREQHMLNEIERFSQSRAYTNSVFTIGAGHRRSLIRMIDYLVNNNMTRLKWSFHSISA